MYFRDPTFLLLLLNSLINNYEKILHFIICLKIYICIIFRKINFDLKQII